MHVQSVHAGEIPHVFTAEDFTLCVRVRPAASTTPALPTATAAPPVPVATSLANVAAITAVATREPLPSRTLRLQLELLHLQLLAWTTAKYEAALIESPTLDPTDTLSGTQASFEALLKRFATSMDYALQAAETLPLPPLLRNAAATALSQVRTSASSVCAARAVARACSGAPHADGAACSTARSSIVAGTSVSH